MVQAVSPEKVRDLLLVRLIVATLGERSSPPWWKTQFLTDVGMRSMCIFPRTALAAALNSVTIVAREDHDKRIGVGGRYHLFRLPTTMEHAMVSALSEESVQVNVMAMMKEGPGGLKKALEAQANGRTVRGAEGPVWVVTDKGVKNAPMSAFAVKVSRYRTMRGCGSD